MGRSFLLMLLVAFLGFVIWKVWRSTHADSSTAAAVTAAAALDPRLSYPTPYRNVRPEVKYVGARKCESCHRGICESYQHHPMGQSMALVASASPIEGYDPAAHNRFAKFGFDFLVERNGNRSFHTTTKRDAQGLPALTLTREVQYVLGSGAHGRTYLSNIDNYLYQTPINWFSHAGRWDMAPNIGAEHGGNLYPGVSHLCIFCHANAAQPIATSTNHYRAPLAEPLAIGCERCHGPGELHVALRKSGAAMPELDDTIVNPRRLEPALRESVCQQCHLLGALRIQRRGTEPFDYRPGLPLRLFWSIFVWPPEMEHEHKAVTQVEQMMASRCYRASGGKLGCVSCHDPHAYPRGDASLDFYRRSCMACHESGAAQCTLPVAEREATNKNSCFACHMPRVKNADVAHSAASDHRVLRNPGKTITVRSEPRLRVVDAVAISYFFDNQLNPEDKDVRRDFAVGLVELFEQTKLPAARAGLLSVAVPMLDQAVEADPEDIPARHARGYALWMQGMQAEALADFEAVLQRSPEREQTLSFAAQLCSLQNRPEAALAYWRRVISVNPWQHTYHGQLARVYGDLGNQSHAIEEYRRALEINPFSSAIRSKLITIYLQSDKAEARKEFDKLLILDPPGAEAMRQKFEEQISEKAVGP